MPGLMTSSRLAAAGAALILVSLPLSGCGTYRSGPGEVAHDPAASAEVGASADAAPSASSLTLLRIPPNFPLAQDQQGPESGTVPTPSPDAEGLSTVAFCDAAVWPAAGVQDRLASNASAPEAGHGRELVTFQSATAARAALEAVSKAAGACPVTTDESGNKLNVVVVPPEQSKNPDAVTVVETSVENPPFGAVYQFTQVGNAVFAIVLGAEWTAESARDAGVREVTGYTDLLRPELEIFAQG